ncbi:MAG: GNAT family N-acetyltransferase [Candidatus Thermoplasmatota archaeon]|jgi:RimJ/RimL family protein N-acetyltransferase|nr:GNAT family N-acetyltransferase [Candidatus Thermoplasmatota archaeon]MCL5983270.1 GNAT family N-acetyltransferase [Candidatus Thermoplasmatota archaeon]
MPESPAVHIERLRTEELPPYLNRLIPEYAQDHVRDGSWTPEEAEGRARSEVESLLPHGVDTPDHYLFAIRAQGEDVGRIWFARRQDAGGRPYAFVYDLLVYPQHRRHGYAEAAMRAIEAKVRELGLERLALHVFGANAGAIRLYQRLGYTTTNILMAKTVRAGTRRA